MKKVVLVSKGRSDWQVVAADGDTPGVAFAGRELRRYIQQMSGGAVRAVDADEGKPTIVLGVRASLAPQDRRLLPKAAKGHDGYAIAVCAAEKGRPARIVIGGDNGRGAVYGVYDLLEKLGCRWYYPVEDPFDPEVVPFKPNLALAAKSWACASYLRHRICNPSEWFFDIDPGRALAQLDWAMKNRYNAIGWQGHSKSPLEAQYRHLRDSGLLAQLDARGMYLHGPAHSFDHFLRAEDHMAEHPEWFGLRDGKRVPQTFAGAQFCWSNPDARRQFVANARKAITEMRQVGVFCSIPFDGGVACACDNCKRIGASNLLVTLAGEMIDMVAEARPDAVFETLGGYAPVTDPPEGVEFHPAFRVVWAHWGRYHGHGYDDPKYDRREDLARWIKACRGGITICEYYTDNFAEPWVMPPFTVAMEGDRKYLLRHRIDSVYMLCWPKGYWWNHSLNGHLAGRVQYDAVADPIALLKDYAMNYYGPKAGPLIASYYIEWARNPDLAYRVKDDTQPGHRDMLARQRKRFIDPAIRAVRGDAVLSHRVGKVAKLHTLAERLGEMHRQRAEVRALRATGRFEAAARKLDRTKVTVEGLLAYFYELADLDQGIMDRKEVPWFITIGVKGWIEDEEKKIREKDRSLPDSQRRQLSETEALPSEVTG
jgi:hypothetical protein